MASELLGMWEPSDLAGGETDTHSKQQQWRVQILLDGYHIYDMTTPVSPTDGIAATALHLGDRCSLNASKPSEITVIVQRMR